MGQLKVAAFLLLSIFCLSDGMKIRSKEYYERIPEVLKFADMLEGQFGREFKNFTETGYRSQAFEGMVTALYAHPDLHRVEMEEIPENFATLTCLLCRAGLGTLISDRRSGKTEAQLHDSAMSLCKTLTSFGEEVCNGVIGLNIEALLYIIDSRPTLTATVVCSLVLQGDCDNPSSELDFTVNVNTGPAITESKSGSTPRNSNELKIIHLTDVHYDPNYMVGANANCNEPTCCRRKGGIAPNVADRAGVWGDYRYCDSPWEAVEDAIRRVKNNHPDVDIIYYTGDIVDHGVWETTVEGNIEIMERTYNLFKSVFGNIPLYPILGNHEAHPVNVFAPSTISRDSISTKWLYDYSADAWKDWLPASALATVRKGGYYTVLVHTGFRIIALNNNDCYTYNWWILYSRDEIRDQLQWFHDTLLEAERNNEKVHVLAHVPAGEGSCYKFWSREYRRIIERFHQTISAQFNGHTHLDEFNIYYDRSTVAHAVSVAWNGGGTTPYHWINPNYIMYYVDRTLYQVNEYDSWIYSLSEANANPTAAPRWFKQYSFKEAFGISDLSPASLNSLAYSLARDRALLRKYWEFKVKIGDPYIAEGCNDACLKGHLCEIVTNEFNDNRKCDEMQGVFNTLATRSEN